MEPRAEVLRLGRGLQGIIKTYRTSARAVSLSLGYHAGQLTLVLNGHRPMRVRLVLEVLADLGAPPGRVFDVLYPLGGVSEVVLRREAGPGLDLPGTRPWSEVVAEVQRAQGPVPTPEALVAKLGMLLRRELREARVSQRQVSRHLGLGDDALGKALRGDSELTFLHVFTVLVVTRRSPERIFLELFRPTPEDPMEQIELAHYLDEAEALRTPLAQRLLPEEKATAEPLAPVSQAPKEPKKSGRKKRKG